MSERTLVTSNETLPELKLIMLRTIVLKYCQLYHPFANTSIPKKSPPFPSFYDVNVSLLSNLSKIQSFSRLFETHSILGEHFTHKHLGMSARLLMKLAYDEQVRQKKHLKKEAYRIESHREDWIKIMKVIFTVDPIFLTKDQLMDFMHLICRSMQLKINYKILSPELKVLYQPFRDSIISKISEQKVLKQMTIAQLISIFHNFISIRSQQEQLSKIMDMIEIKLNDKPYCTCFHMLLLNNHLEYIKGRGYSEQQILRLQEICAKIVAEQLPIVMNYVNIFVLIEVYNLLDGKRPQFNRPLLLRVYELLPELSQTPIKSSFANKNISIFIAKLKLKQIDDSDIESEKISSTLLAYISKSQH